MKNFIAISEYANRQNIWLILLFFCKINRSNKPAIEDTNPNISLKVSNIAWNSLFLALLLRIVLGVWW